jgi:hypothetical protein
MELFVGVILLIYSGCCGVVGVVSLARLSYGLVL